MSYPFPPDLQHLIHQGMAFGNYASDDDLLRDALQALISQHDDLMAIRAGVEDMNSGRVRPLQQVDAEIRGRLGFESSQ